MIAGYVLVGRLRLTEGEIDKARTWLQRTRSLIEGTHFSDWTARYQRFRIELWLAQSKFREAARWAGERTEEGEPGEGPEEVVAHLAMARLLIAGGETSASDWALGLLARLLEAAEAEGRLGLLIEALALQAMAHRQRGDSAGAMTSLERALRLAEPEGYVRLVTDLGAPMARLLQDARARAVLPDYVERLLGTFAGDLSSPTPVQEELPEPLTAREQEVLELLAAGLTKREIADVLVISPETAKKHTGNIYAKLAVSNRREAAARARILALLDSNGTNDSRSG